MHCGRTASTDVVRVLASAQFIMATDLAEFLGRCFLTALLYREVSRRPSRTDSDCESRNWELLGAGAFLLLIVEAWFGTSRLVTASVMSITLGAALYACYVAVTRRSTRMWSFVALQAASGIEAVFPIAGPDTPIALLGLEIRYDRVAYGFLVIVALTLVAILDRRPTKPGHSTAEERGNPGRD